jgi:hypothetical protein
VKLDGGLSLCVEIKQKGDGCTHRALCDDHLYCVFDNFREGHCRAPCENPGTASSGCDRGEECRLLEDRVALCVPAEESLRLDENAHDFGSGNEPKESGEAKKRVQTDETSMGCTHISKTADLWFLVAVIVMFRLGRLRKNQKASN